MGDGGDYDDNDDNNYNDDDGDDEDNGDDENSSGSRRREGGIITSCEAESNHSKVRKCFHKAQYHFHKALFFI